VTRQQSFVFGNMDRNINTESTKIEQASKVAIAKAGCYVEVTEIAIENATKIDQASKVAIAKVYQLY
jgi:hypothetical protein